jgi:Uma2 family endonuclease
MKMAVQPTKELETLYAVPASVGVMEAGRIEVGDVAELEAMLAELEALTAQLPGDDGRPMEYRRHRSQISLLFSVLEYAWRMLHDFFAGGNMFVYYSTAQGRRVIHEVAYENNGGEPPPPGPPAYRGPDFFVVKGIDGSYLRQKWVAWEEEGRYPDLIVELLSASTRDKDLGEKKELYERVFRTAEYFVWDTFDPRQFQGWHLVNGRYEPIQPNERGWLWSNVLEMWLGPWEGTYERDHTVWLRFYNADGNLVLMGEEAAEERAEVAEERAEVAEERAEAERRRAEAAEAELERLRALLGQPGGGEASQ